MQKLLLGLIVIMILVGIVFAFSGSIFLLEPENNTFTRNSLLNFSFYFTDPVNQTAPCLLFIDGSKQAENDTVFNNTITTFTPVSPLTNGSHYWYVECDYTNSEQRILTVDQAEPTLGWLRPKKIEGIFPLIPRNSLYTIKIRVNGTFSPWDKLFVNVSDCGGYLANESEWNITDIDETTSDVEIEWNTSDTKLGFCSLFATANDTVGYSKTESVRVLMIDTNELEYELEEFELKLFEIKNVDVRPDVPTTDDDLTCHWNVSIFLVKDGNKNYTANVTWFNDSVRYTDWDVNNILCNGDEECSSPIPVPSSATTENNTWTCQVTATYMNITDSKNGTEVIGNYSFLEIGDIPDPVTVGQNVTFWADYENYGGFDIYPGSCNITAFSTTKSMKYIQQNSRYESVFTAPAVGTHTWNVSCSAPLYMPQSASSTITVNPIPGGNQGGGGGRRGGGLPDSEPPTVRLISPLDGSVIENLRPTFRFYVNDNQDDKLECALYIGSINLPSLVYAVDREVLADSIKEFKPGIDLDEKVYNWRIECKDDSGNNGVSDSWFFTIKLPTNITGTEELQMNVTTPSPVTGAAIVGFFKSPIPWVGIVILALLISSYFLYKKWLKKEEKA